MKQRQEAAHWRSLAACATADPELFFPVSEAGMALEDSGKAKALCAGCAVRGDCLTFALRTRQAHGIWGGMTVAERALTWRSLRGERLRGAERATGQYQ